MFRLLACGRSSLVALAVGVGFARCLEEQALRRLVENLVMLPHQGLVRDPEGPSDLQLMIPHNVLGKPASGIAASAGQRARLRGAACEEPQDDFECACFRHRPMVLQRGGADQQGLFYPRGVVVQARSMRPGATPYLPRPVWTHYLENRTAERIEKGPIC